MSKETEGRPSPETRAEWRVAAAENDVERTMAKLLSDIWWCERTLRENADRIKRDGTVETFLPTNVSCNLAASHAAYLTALAVLRALKQK